MDLSRMTEQERNETRQEAKILSVLKHPSIINFREVFTTVSNKLCIVMDYADGGDLQKKIKENKGKFFAESQILDWFTQICLGLKHVHDRKILHRDIKTQNIFMTKTNRCLLGDFGIAKILSNTKGFARTVVGTPYYLSPEILESKHYGFQSDIWSLGILLYELCALKPPFDAPNLPFLAMKIVRGNYAPISSHYSRELRNLITQMLMIDPAKRPNIHQVLRMGFIQARVKNFLNETEYKSEFSHTILHSVNILSGKENRGLGGAVSNAQIGLSSPAFGQNRDLKSERMRLERERLLRLKEKEIEEKKRIAELQKKIEQEAEIKRIEETEKKRLEELNKIQIEEEKRLQERREEISKLKLFKSPLIMCSPRNKEDQPKPKKSNPQIIANPIFQPIVKRNDKMSIVKGEKKKYDQPKSLAKKSKNKLEVDKKVNEKVKNWDEERKKMKEDIKKQRKKIQQSNEASCVYVTDTERKNAQEGQMVESTSKLIKEQSEEDLKKKVTKGNKNKSRYKQKRQSKECNKIESESNEVDDNVKAQNEMNNYMLMMKEMEELISDKKDEGSIDCESLTHIEEEPSDCEGDRDDVLGNLEEETPLQNQKGKESSEEINCGTKLATIVETKGKTIEKNLTIAHIDNDKKSINTNDNGYMKEYLEGLFGKENCKKIIDSVVKVIIVVM